jgi:hypothetical protein
MRSGPRHCGQDFESAAAGKTINADINKQEINFRPKDKVGIKAVVLDPIFTTEDRHG